MGAEEMQVMVRDGLSQGLGAMMSDRAMCHSPSPTSHKPVWPLLSWYGAMLVMFAPTMASSVEGREVYLERAYLKAPELRCINGKDHRRPRW